MKEIKTFQDEGVVSFEKFPPRIFPPAELHKLIKWIASQKVPKEKKSLIQMGIEMEQDLIFSTCYS